MLPNDPVKVREALLRWTRGDVPAADFLLFMAKIARIADDIVDDDRDRQKHVCWLLSYTLTVLPANPFFSRHAAALGPMINTIIVQWQQSDEYRVSGDPLKQQFGFVMRESIGSLVTAVASICGGVDHAKTAAEDFFQMCHAGSTETVAQWVGE